MLFAASLTVAQAQEHASRKDAVALVKRTVEFIKKVGIEPVVKAINNRDKRFLDRDLYLFVHDLRKPALLIAHGSNKDLAGKNTIDLRDQNGKYFVREMYEVAETEGSGWVDYRWANATRTGFEEKTSYVERVGDYFVGVGVYKSNEPNKNTVGIISGNPLSAPTYLQMAYDLSVVLNEGDDLRIVPVVGIGGAQNIRDVQSLRGIDVGFTQSNVLNTFRRNNKEQVGDAAARSLVYIAKLFTEEVHVVAGSDISSIAQLAGKKVNLGEIGSGTQFTMRDIFKALGISIEEVNVPQTDALEMVRRGEIAATILVSGKSVPTIANLKRTAGFRMLPIAYAPALQEDYLPAELSADDYPDLIEPGKTVETVAVSAVLIAYNWEEGSDRYRRVKKFAEALLDKIDEFQKPPRHPKWREVNLASTLPGWERFEPMTEMLANRPATFEVKPTKGEEPVPASDDTAEPIPADKSIPADEEELFRKFKEWLKSR